MLRDLRKSHEWEDQLKTANDLFYMGPKKYEDALRRYTKILEILLRQLYKETLPTLPREKKAKVFEAEEDVGKEKAFEKLGLGQMIGVFSRSSLFEHVNKHFKTHVLEPKLLNDANDFRIEQTHYDDDAVRHEVDQIRQYVTTILLEFKLISKDPETEMIPRPTKTSEDLGVKQRRLENLQRIVKKLRLGLVDNPIVKDQELLEGEPGYFCDVQVEGEIVGVILASDENFVVMVKVLTAQGPEEEEPTYEILSTKVRETIEGIAPEVKQRFRILFFNETDGHGFDSAYVSWTDKEGIEFP